VYNSFYYGTSVVFKFNRLIDEKFPLILSQK